MNDPSTQVMHDREFDPSDPSIPVEIATLEQLRERVGDAELQLIGRVYFHVVIICTAGEGIHEVDFTPITLSAGRVVHVQPGQVHRWRLARDYQATILFFRDERGVDPRGGDWSIGPRSNDLNDQEASRACEIVGLMLDEYALVRSPESRDRALTGALQMLLVSLGLDRSLHADTVNFPRPYVELMRQLEADRQWSRSVKDRADRLGYSGRTLTRACQAAVGLSAKEVIDSRVMLEARRLLIHPANTVESIARQLSFSEPSNFAKFFHRMTGENPNRWRERQLR